MGVLSDAQLQARIAALKAMSTVRDRGLEERVIQLTTELDRVGALRNFYMQALWALAKGRGGLLAIDADAFRTMQPEDMVSIALSADESKILVNAYRIDSPKTEPTQ